MKTRGRGIEGKKSDKLTPYKKKTTSQGKKHKKQKQKTKGFIIEPFEVGTSRRRSVSSLSSSGMSFMPGGQEGSGASSLRRSASLSHSSWRETRYPGTWNTWRNISKIKKYIQYSPGAAPLWNKILVATLGAVTFEEKWVF